MKVSERINLVPVLNGSVMFQRAVRRICAESEPDRILLSLPENTEESLAEIVDLLPEIHASVIRFPESSHLYYIPADPCDPMIEGIRQARQRLIPFICAGGVFEETPPELPPLPDHYTGEWLGRDALNSLCLRSMSEYTPDNNEEEAAQRIAQRILSESEQKGNLTALIHFRYYLSVLRYLDRPEKDHLPEPHSQILSEYRVDTDTLYFILGELPFATGVYEQERYDPFALEKTPAEIISLLFRETREGMYSRRGEAHELSPVRLQNGIKFLRNLTLLESRLNPSLFDIVTAAKGIGGNRFGLSILKQAKYYPFLPVESDKPLFSAGIDKVHLEGDVSFYNATNILQDSRLVWRSLSIKPDPSIEKKEEYRYRWNPYGMCSHVPEDNRIESFNSRVRARAVESLNEAHVKTEKFQTSVKDGIDIRQTLRNWYTDSIYVKEIPPTKGKVDTVVVIFDEDHDEHYPSRTTWYAEHREESTLSFYATDPFSDLIGPGVARCYYGGLSMIFPPVNIPNMFSLDY
ncbi:MAG: hypothetical protein ACOCSE_05425, partial [Chitinivibrionales bacterium]